MYILVASNLFHYSESYDTIFFCKWVVVGGSALHANWRIFDPRDLTFCCELIILFTNNSRRWTENANPILQHTITANTKIRIPHNFSINTFLTFLHLDYPRLNHCKLKATLINLKLNLQIHTFSPINQVF